MVNNKVAAVLLAVLAAVFYAINTPLSKLLLEYVPSTFMAAFLYLGAGLSIGCIYAFHWKSENRTERLARKDLPFTIGMIILDVAAPIFLMLGMIEVSKGTLKGLITRPYPKGTTFVSYLDV